MAHIETELSNGILARAGTATRQTLKPITLMLAAGTMLASAGMALAAVEPATLKTMTFQATGGTAPIHVISTDKKKWNALKPATIVFQGAMNIEAKLRGRISTVGVALGACGKNTCSAGLVTFVQSLGDKTKKWSGTKNMGIQTANLPMSSASAIAVVPYADQIIAKCNQHLAANGPTKRYSFNHTFHATFLAVSRKNNKLNKSGTGDASASSLVANAQHAVADSFTVPVTCDPVLKSGGDVVAKQPDFKVKSIQLFRTTYSHAVSRPNPGTTCKKAKWLVRLGTSKAGPVKFKLWMKVGNGPMTSKVIEAWSKFDGNSKYKAEYSEWTSVSKTTSVQAMAEDMTNPIGQSTGWKDITLHCTGAGGGGLTNAPTSGGNHNAQAGQANPRPLTNPRPQAGAPKLRPGHRLGQAKRDAQRNARPGVRRDRESVLQRRRVVR